MGSITPMGNADAFPGTSFGWFCPRPVFLLARRNGPLSALLNVGRYESLQCDLALLLFSRERSGELPKDNSSSTGLSMLLERWASFLYRKRSSALLDCYLAHLFFQDRTFFLPRLANDLSHTVDVQNDLSIPSSPLLAPPASSQSLDANGGIDLQVFDASDCSTLCLLVVTRTRKGESKAF